MRLFPKVHQLPARLTAGTVILNSGLDLAGADPGTATGLHGMATGTYPFLGKQDPVAFVKLLSKAEIAVGAALLVPMVPSLVAGAALTAFAGGLIGLYLRTPGMRREGSLRPSQEGIGLVKDVWLLGIGLSLVTEELLDRPGRGGISALVS
ncbi:hypothetical protein [Nonomuraea roseoviolacea]|uniref:DoxX family membrane protein n=1 Tax=Nonomuraea roseoviolacea subsp. carminata TaxID=160689 RepID=A0ABT1K6K8_9ACTN|nr:hypothetical protein [Nonomuraea roseoviolacea]MCP2349634.1 hypothetical protein [Nonomuraea roseoviolacea subsp. carminata]